jgi:hypothetical protein
MEGGVKRYRFKLVDCAAIVGELDAVGCSTRRSGAALKDICLREILAVNKNCHE